MSEFDQNKIKILKIVTLAIENLMDQNIETKGRLTSFNTLVSQYGKSVKITPKLTRPFIEKPLIEVFKELRGFPPESEINNNLVSAAPDLLRACELALEKFGEIDGSYPVDDEIEMLAKAISKAKGESQ